MLEYFWCKNNSQGITDYLRIVNSLALTAAKLEGLINKRKIIGGIIIFRNYSAP